MADGMPRATIYRVVKQYLYTKSIVRRSGSGRPAKKMTREKREALRRSVNHKTGISQRALARKFGCDQSYISRTIKRLKINCRKRVKVPKYKDEVAIKEVQKNV